MISSKTLMILFFILWILSTGLWAYEKQKTKELRSELLKCQESACVKKEDQNGDN